ncbi:uncharacterized protein PpBr36_06192 [Pyricularia pennisetigena]|uniref:uncharacterized protein n=1 Tax=Pyricularia pennisetigena TaxID=1578925 RepID=UPI001151CBFB|nr:uncharacterized protein PpBr36_06192 [Pyricularia pennisetigena]TLS23360.1 hypothetical protein PpBr36_06192 [Pyricularia pennisetigena]
MALALWPVDASSRINRAPSLPLKANVAKIKAQHAIRLDNAKTITAQTAVNNQADHAESPGLSRGYQADATEGVG